MRTLQDKINSINEVITNSNYNYIDRNKEAVLTEMKENRDNALNGVIDMEEFVYDEEEFYSTYINEANITRYELDFDGSGQFQIGNNLPSAE